MTKVFIVVLNWNQPDLTIECLESVYKLHVKNYELRVIVVDNGSSDDSVQKLNTKKANAQWNVVVLETGDNLGFAGGNNVGIQHALNNNADYVVLLNNDTVVSGNLIDGLLRTYKENPKAGAVSPKIYFAKGYEFHKNKYGRDDLGKVIWYAGGKMDWNNVYGSNVGVDEVDTGQFEKTKETDFATGCCVMFPKSVLEKVGLLDEKYYLYMEDADLCERIKKSGYKIFYTPHAHLWHKVSQSSGIGSQLNDYFITRNRLMFGMKYASLRTKFALIRESLRFLISGREWQKIGVHDFYKRNFGRGSWK
jgi:GT2 family glycosyltransferase